MMVKGAEGRKEAHVPSPLEKIFVRFSFYMLQIVNVNSPWRREEGGKVKDFFLLEAGSSHAKGTHMGDAIGRKAGRTPLPPRKRDMLCMQRKERSFPPLFLSRRTEVPVIGREGFLCGRV